MNLAIESLRGNTMLKRILSGVSAAVVATAVLAADTKISAFSSMSALTGSEIFVGNQSSTTKTGSALQIATYTLAAPPVGIGSTTPTTGAFTTLSSTGLLSSILGLTVTGAVASLNTSSNFNTTINTGTSTGTTTIGNTAGTGSALAVNAPLTLSLGTALSQASWTTTGIGIVVPAATFNDTTTGSGGVGTEAIYAIGAPTITNTQGTANVLTNAITLRVAAPICGSGWASCTNLYSIVSVGRAALSLGADITGGSLNATGTVSLNASNNAATNIGTGTTNSNVSIGNGANLNTLGPTQITTGTVFTAAAFTGCSVTNGTPGTLSGGPQGGSFVGNSNGTTCSVVITINGATGKTASHGWACWGSDITSAVVLAQSATTTTTCTLKGTVAANGDTIVFMAMGY